MESDGLARDEERLSNAAALVEGRLRLSQIVRLRFNEWLSDFDLNDGRHALLVALARAGEVGCSQADMADRLGQSESNISTLIERMERDGLVSRSRSDADRRKRVLRITATGLTMLSAVDSKRSLWAGRLLNGIPADDIPNLALLLQRLGTSLDRTFAIPQSMVSSPRSVSTIPNRNAADGNLKPDDDPTSPQFALRQMLLELSSTTASGMLSATGRESPRHDDRSTRFEHSSTTKSEFDLGKVNLDSVNVDRCGKDAA